MKTYEPETYGDRIADSYDEMYPAPDEGAVDLLAELAGPDPVLELGIGTGRIAIPLAERGIDVRGVDASPAMIERLRAKPGGGPIPVHSGDFAAFDLPDRFGLVFVVFNTFFAMLSQEAQVRCFRTVARHLLPGGRFLLELFVPDPARFDRGQRLGTVRVETGSALLEATRHDPVSQTVDSQLIRIREEGTRLFPVRLRYAWPAELDLMARLAGLEPEHRWGGWRKQKFDADSQLHVSVYRASTESD